MKKTKKSRLNLYLRNDAIQFAKKWSYVTNKPISKMLEEYLNSQKDLVASITPFQWLNDPVINPALSEENEYFRNLEEYLNNREEEEFCKQNADHPRAKMRKALLEEYEDYERTILEKQKENNKDLIQRWMEVFTE